MPDQIPGSFTPLPSVPPPPPPPSAPAAPPPNLPTAEAEDIFADVPEPSVAAGGPAQAVPPIAEQAARGGLGKRILIAGGAAVLLIIAAVVVWLVFFRSGEEVPSETPGTTSAPSASNAPTTPAPSGAVESGSVGEPSVSPAGEVTEPPAPPPAPVADADGDGLSDAEEEQLGTNVNSADSDGDGLADRDEVKTYQTDPLNGDTDGDTYPDGIEVRGGYNPKGKGLLFEVPPAP